MNPTLLTALEGAYILLLSQSPEFRLGCQRELSNLRDALCELRAGMSSQEVQDFYESKALSLRLLGDKDKEVSGEALAVIGYVPASDFESGREIIFVGNTAWRKP
jgi:peroxiredoxin